jgi:hypothetical protein
MNDSVLIWEKYTSLHEANLISKDPLHLELEKILKEKNVQNSQIKDWFLKTYIKWFQSPADDNQKIGFISPYQAKDNDPEWAKKEGIYQFNQFTPEYRDRLSHLIDFLNTKDENYLKSLFKVTVPQMFEEVQKWDREMERSAEKAKNAKLQSVEGVDYEVVGVYEGYPVWKLISNKSFREESMYMGHCVGQAKGETKVTSIEGGESEYFKLYKEYHLEIYSLRDPKENNHPVVTFELREDSQDGQFKIYQIKGPANRSVSERYRKACRGFIEDGEYIVKKDGENIGMIEWNKKFYFEDSQKFKNIYNYQILPAQRKAISELMGRIKNNNIDGNVYLGNLFLKELPDLSQISIYGEFDCSNNRLTSLVGSPYKVTTGFYCNNNKLKNLIGAPKIGTEFMNFYCNNNELETLNGSPNEVYFFNCSNNRLKSLEGSPIYAYEFDCSDNQITTLQGRLKKVKGKFNCSNNKLNSLDYAPEIKYDYYTYFICNDNLKFFEYDDIQKCQIEAKDRNRIDEEQNATKLESFKNFYTKSYNKK